MTTASIIAHHDSVLDDFGTSDHVVRSRTTGRIIFRSDAPIARLVAVLACSFSQEPPFTSASLSIQQMEIRIWRSPRRRFPPSYRRATIMQATLAAVGLIYTLAAWLAGELAVGGWWGRARLCSPIHSDSDPANRRSAGPTLDKRSDRTVSYSSRWAMIPCVEACNLLSALFALLFS